MLATITLHIRAEKLKTILDRLEDEAHFFSCNVKREKTLGLWRLALTCNGLHADYFKTNIINSNESL